MQDRFGQCGQKPIEDAVFFRLPLYFFRIATAEGCGYPKDMIKFINIVGCFF